jgi:hypothetical protein
MLRKNDASLRNRTENVAAPIHVWIPILKLCEQVVSAAASTMLKKSSTRAKGDAAHEVLEATLTCQYQLAASHTKNFHGLATTLEAW